MSLNNPIQILSEGQLFSPNVGTTVLGNIPSLPLISPRDLFLQSLESWISAPSMSTQWVVLFDAFPKTLNQAILQNLENISGDKGGWNIDIAVDSLGNYFFQRLIGCLFAQEFQTPDQRLISYNEQSKRGFMGAQIARDRRVVEPLELSFLETNLSFVDAMIRPWTILASHKGMVARPDDESIKTNIHIYQYTRTNQFLSQIPRKIWSFYDCVPVGVSGSQYSYSNENIEIRKNIRFSYNWYQVYNTTYIPIPTLIEKFTNGGIQEILNVQRVTDSIDNVRNNPLQTIGGVVGNAGIGGIIGAL